MTTALTQALEVIEARIQELQQDNELTRLLAARAALKGQDAPDPAMDVATLQGQRDALQRTLEEAQSERDEALTAVRKLSEDMSAQKEVVETQRQAISSLRKQLEEVSGKPTPVPLPKPATKQTAKDRGPIPGFNELEEPLPDQVLQILSQKFGTREFGFSEAVKAVQTAHPTANQFKVKNRLGILRDQGRASHNGKTARGSRWRIPKESTAPKSTATAVAAVHRFVRDQREPFSAARVAEATGLPREVVVAILEDLCDRRIATDISPSPDMRLFEYSKPTEPGAAAEHDAARKAATGPDATAEPVAGTGRGPKVRNKELQALIDACIKTGAKVLQAGNGHFAVTYGSKRTLISSTPSNPRSVLNDRTRLRRAGVPV